MPPTPSRRRTVAAASIAVATLAAAVWAWPDDARAPLVDATPIEVEQAGVVGPDDDATWAIAWLTPTYAEAPAESALNASAAPRPRRSTPRSDDGGSSLDSLIDQYRMNPPDLSVPLVELDPEIYRCPPGWTPYDPC